MAMHLPFSTIKTIKLVPLADVVTKYRNLSAIHRAPTLAVKLAQLSYFWRRGDGPAYGDGLQGVAWAAYC